jgi:hypothetical protein
MSVKVIEHSLAKVREGRVAIVVASVETVGEARFGQQLPRLGRVEYRGWWFPVEFGIRAQMGPNFG